MIEYELAEGISEDFLRKSAESILEVWMKKQPGFLGWDINKGKDGFVDFVYWKTLSHAENATKNMKDIPEGHDWMKCYKMETVKAEKIETLFSSRQ